MTLQTISLMKLLRFWKGTDWSPEDTIFGLLQLAGLRAGVAEASLKFKDRCLLVSLVAAVVMRFEGWAE